MTASTRIGGLDRAPVDLGLAVNTDIEQINVGVAGIKWIKPNMSKREFKLAFAGFTERSRTTSKIPMKRSTGLTKA